MSPVPERKRSKSFAYIYIYASYVYCSLDDSNMVEKLSKEAETESVS